jgi:hypothetical protein
MILMKTKEYFIIHAQERSRYQIITQSNVRPKLVLYNSIRDENILAKLYIIYLFNNPLMNKGLLVEISHHVRNEEWNIL